MSCEDLFFKQLHQRGFRLTPQRELVLSVLHQLGRAASADEVFAQVARRSARMELSTVYRTLDLLTALEFVSVIDLGEKQRLFELRHSSIPHLHLVCRACGKITGIELNVLGPLLAQIHAEFHFETDFNNMTIPGTCAECASQPA